jgi:hypothetical protein
MVYKQILFRMPSSGMLRGVTVVRIDVSEGSLASINRAPVIGELGKTLVVN